MNEMMIPDKINSESEQAVHNYNRIYYDCSARAVILSKDKYDRLFKDDFIPCVYDYDYTEKELSLLDTGIIVLLISEEDVFDYLIKLKEYINPDALVYLLLTIGRNICMIPSGTKAHWSRIYSYKDRIRLYSNTVFMRSLDNVNMALHIIESLNAVYDDLFDKDVFNTSDFLPIVKKKFDPSSYNDMNTYDEQLLTLLQFPYACGCLFYSDCELLYAIIDYMINNHKYMSIEELKHIMSNDDEYLDSELITTCRNFVSKHDFTKSRKWSFRSWRSLLSKIDKSNNNGMTSVYLIHLCKLVDKIVCNREDKIIHNIGELYSIMMTISELDPDYPSEFLMQNIIYHYGIKSEEDAVQ